MIRNRYRMESSKDVYSDYDGCFDDDYVYWLEKKLEELQSKTTPCGVGAENIANCDHWNDQIAGCYKCTKRFKEL